VYASDLCESFFFVCAYLHDMFLSLRVIFVSCYFGCCCLFFFFLVSACCARFFAYFIVTFLRLIFQLWTLVVTVLFLDFVILEFFKSSMCFLYAPLLKRSVHYLSAYLLFDFYNMYLYAFFYSNFLTCFFAKS
jgi:hypothetical protein